MKIEACPVCRYCLRGLTEPLRCPECGLQLGIEPLVFRPSGNAWLILALGSGAAAILDFIFLLKSGRPPVLFWWVAILAFQSLACVVQRWRARRTFVIVSTGEVRVFRNMLLRAVIPLEGHTNARWEWTTGEITLERNGTEPAVSFVPPSRKLRREILQAVEHRLGKSNGENRATWSGCF